MATIHAEAQRTEVTSPYPLTTRLAAEALGTFWLVLGGCGTAVLGSSPAGGPGLLGIALAFGLTVATAAYALGPISGGHFNPAVSVGLWSAGRFSGREILPYGVAQLLGAFVGACVVFAIATAAPYYEVDLQGLAQNGYGPGSPGGFGLSGALIAETVLTAGFLIVIAGATDARAVKDLAPLCIGLTLTLIHLISIPVTNTSVNPARSTGPALLVGGLAIQQLWLFWVAPLVGGLAGGAIYRFAFGRGPR